VTSALHYTRDAAHYLAFYCPGDHHGSDLREPHPAEINFHGGVPCTLRCELVEERTFRLPPGHERWFTEVRSRVCMTRRCAVNFMELSQISYEITLKELEPLLRFTTCKNLIRFLQCFPSGMVAHVVPHIRFPARQFNWTSMRR